jgi:hypothetical protein
MKVGHSSKILAKFTELNAITTHPKVNGNGVLEHL